MMKNPKKKISYVPFVLLTCFDVKISRNRTILYNRAWPFRWPYMSFHACAVLKESSFGATRTTEPDIFD